MDLTKTHWKTAWEDAADAEQKKLDSTDVEILLEMVKNGDYGSFYGIWSSIANRATVQQAGFILLEVLHGDSWYTLRANCAQALLKLMNEDEIRTVDISADRPDQDDFLQRIEMKLMELLAGE
ncbi:MAG: hypothetical protein KAS73_01970 [Candidatus Sabulitectum sp.]|nr:hypothetical protein [Candidatus Sabulitectum sp.]